MKMTRPFARKIRDAEIPDSILTRSTTKLKSLMADEMMPALLSFGATFI